MSEANKPAKRLPLELNINFRRSYGRKEESGKLQNISITGAFLKTDHEDLAPRDKLIITFEVSGRVRKIDASIVWNNEHGCGIRFQPFNNRDVQIVDDLMYFVDSQRESRRSVFKSIIDQVS